VGGHLHGGNEGVANEWGMKRGRRVQWLWRLNGHYVRVTEDVWFLEGNFWIGLGRQVSKTLVAFLLCLVSIG
jgi:hypothetical protein